MERELPYRPPTNDRSESELALLRRVGQKGKIHNTLRHSCSVMYARNDAAVWHTHHLASQDFEGRQEFGMYVSKHARSLEKTGGAKEKQREIIRESERKAEINRIVKKAKEAAQAKRAHATTMEPIVANSKRSDCCAPQRLASCLPQSLQGKVRITWIEEGSPSKGGF